MNRFLKIFYVIVFALFMYSCNVTKHVKSDEFLLYKTKILVNGKSENKIYSDLFLYLKQNPNYKVFYKFPLSLYAYNYIDEKYIPAIEEWQKTKQKTRQNKRALLKKYNLKNSGFSFNFWLHKVGAKPIIYDSLKVKSSEENLKQYFFSQGFFDSEVTHKLKTKNRKVKITYLVKTKKPYSLDSLKYDIKTAELDSMLMSNLHKSYLKNTDIYKEENLIEERERITDLYKNNGYYNFNKKYIEYEVDTNKVANKKVHVLLRIKDENIVTNDSTYTKPHKKYRFGRVNIVTNYSPEKKELSITDSLLYKKYNLYSYGKLKYKPNFITNNILFKKGDLYSQKAIRDTYKNFSTKNAFASKSVKTFVKGDEIITNIILTPLKKYSMVTDFEASFSNYYGFGIASKLGFVNRNVFGGGENWENSIRVSFGTVETGNDAKNRLFNAQEIGVESKIKFPRLLIPFINSANNSYLKDRNPSSNLGFGISFQNNIGLGKVRFNGILDYNWSGKNDKIKHKFELINWQYILNRNKEQYFVLFPSDLKVQNDIVDAYKTQNPSVVNPDIETVLSDDAFLLNNKNLALDYTRMLLRFNRITRDYLFTSMAYTFSYNQQNDDYYKNPIFLSAKIESSGNTLSALSNLFSLSENSDGEKQIFGVSYAQYLKLDLDFRKYINISKNHQFAFRTFIGVSYPYGNSSFVPFDKSFFSGGANDIRAWRAYELGPGTSENFNTYSTESIKLTTSFEYRFGIYKNLKGALFVDAGNIWSINNDNENKFELNSFYQELGIGGGFGFRYDFSFFVFRIDAAFKMHDPSIANGSKWIIDKIQPRDAVINFSIGYPF